MNRQIIEKFFNDPDWAQVETMLRSYCEPLVDMNNLDFTQNSTQFKAELRANLKVYNALSKFLQDSKVISRPLKDITNPFK